MEINKNKRPQTVREFLNLLDDNTPAAVPTPTPAPVPTPAPAAGDSEETLPTQSRTVGPASGNAGKPSPSDDKKKVWLWSILGTVVVVAALFGIGSLLKPGENTTPALADSLAVADSLALTDSLPAPAAADPSASAPAEPAAEQEYGTLKIESTPAGAAIWLDGKNTKKTTPELFEEVAPGSHKVVLKLDGHADASKSVTVKPDERTTCTLTLKEVAQPQTPTQTTAPAPAPTPSNVTSLGNGWTKTKSGNKTTYSNGEVSFTMVDVRGGVFMMGSSYADSEAEDDEKPAHRVTVSDFSIGETEVTQALWLAVMGSNPSKFTGNLQRPVEMVSYNDCKTFISRLNSLTGENFRLPTEAEWEFAARGGIFGQGYVYSGGNSIDNIAWYFLNSLGKGGGTTHPVKTKSPNELDLYDMSGSVYEWCNDWHDDNYYNNSPQSNPRGPQSGSFRVLRGGSWTDSAGHCRVAYRDRNSPDFRSKTYGVRLAQ